MTLSDTIREIDEDLIRKAEERLGKLVWQFKWMPVENDFYSIAITYDRGEMPEVIGASSKLAALKNALIHAEAEVKAECRYIDEEYELIDHPLHYGGTEAKHEAISVIEEWNLGFHLGNVVKYISRAGKKPNQEIISDLRKAKWYLDRFIEMEEGDV